MRRATLLLAACVLTGVMALAAAADDPAVAKVREAYAAAVNAGDAAKVASLYTETGVEMPPNRELVKGRSAIEAYHKQLNATGQATITITPLETSSSGSIAFDAGTYKQTIKLKSGGAIDERGKYVVVMKKDAGGEWRVAYAAYNSDASPSPAPAPKQ